MEFYFVLIRLVFWQNADSHAIVYPFWVSQVALLIKNSPVSAGEVRHGFKPWVGKIPWGRAQQTTPAFFPGESPGQRSLVDHTVHRITSSETWLFSTSVTLFLFCSVLFSSVAQLCPTLCDPMNHSTPGLPVHHQLPESTQTHVHWVSDAIEPSHPLPSPSPSALSLSQHHQMSQLFAWGSQNIGVSAAASVLPMNIQDWSPSGWTDWISLQSKGLSRVFSNTTVQKHQFFSAQLSL